MKNKPSNTVYISNLSYERDRNGLKSIFSPYGTIKNIKIIVEPKTNQSRGMAFVEMGSIQEATAAIEGLNGKVLDGRTTKANYAIPMRESAKKKDELDEKPKKKVEKDLDYKAIQLAKKARNESKKKNNPLYQKKVAVKK
jgi:RNA recognition motif-containing protein